MNTHQPEIGFQIQLKMSFLKNLQKYANEDRTPAKIAPLQM